MKVSKRWLCASGLLMSFTGCAASSGGGDEGESSENLGQAVFELTSVPTGINCVRIKVTVGSETVTTDKSGPFANPSTAIAMDRLPLGNAVVDGTAYAESCGSVGNNPALWVADTETTLLDPGLESTLKLTFRKNNVVDADVSFVGNITDLSVGLNGTAVVIDGKVWQFGTIYYAADVPRVVSGLSNVAQVSVGSGHACAVTTGGELWCWGGGGQGQMGGSTNSSSGIRVGTSTSYTSVSAGSSYTCATEGTRLTCFGLNTSGQLGNNTTTSTSAPVQLNFAVGRALDAGASAHTCASTTTGVLQCWGEGTQGQLGSLPSTGASLVPINANMAPAIAVGTGTHFTIALLGNGTVKSVGYNNYGTLGDGTTTSKTAPVSVSGLSGVSQISVGNYHACAVSAGQVRCWGSNSSGQLGDGTFTNRSTPVLVPALPPVEKVACGFAHTCALTQDHEVYCWGLNDVGQLGDGTKYSAFTPQLVTLL